MQISASAPAAICLLVSVPLLKTPRASVWQFFKKLNLHVPYDPAFPLLSSYPKELWVESRDLIFAHPHSKQHDSP
jgi:hypothetical protein